MLVRACSSSTSRLLTESPLPASTSRKSGGFLDPIIGTVILTVLATLIAVPLGVATAIWLTEYGRPAGLARAVESGVEIVAGTPSIVLAIFGLLVFQEQLFALLSFDGGGRRGVRPLVLRGRRR